MKIFLRFFFICTMFYPFASVLAQQSGTLMTEQDLIGNWQCDSYLHGSTYQQGGFAPGWKVEDGGLTVGLRSHLNFTEASDHSFQVTSSAPNPVNIYSTAAIESQYKIKSGQVLAFTYNKDGANHLYEIRKVSEAQIILYPVADGFFPTISCDRQAVETVAVTTNPEMGSGGN